MQLASFRAHTSGASLLQVVFDGSEYQPGSTEAVQDKVIIQADNGGKGAGCWLQ
jgi:hypothetical protein